MRPFKPNKGQIARAEQRAARARKTERKEQKWRGRKSATCVVASTTVRSARTAGTWTTSTFRPRWQTRYCKCSSLRRPASCRPLFCQASVAANRCLAPSFRLRPSQALLRGVVETAVRGRNCASARRRDAARPILIVDMEGLKRHWNALIFPLRMAAGHQGLEANDVQASQRQRMQDARSLQFER